ncbi:MAG: PepSY domain-containing protein [Chitinophagaceae bacterium]|nr:MAG: PepSY domain-containing protein [Chitinophagaceae bacterium]
MKIFFRRIHLYLGIAAGLIIMITCLTGAILVYEKELMKLFNHSRYYVAVQPNRLSTDSLINRLKTQEPKASVQSIKIYNNPESTVEIAFTAQKGKGNKAAAGAGEKGKAGQTEGTRLTAFMNPYTGEVAEIYNHRESFFYWVMDVHRWMLGGKIGKMVVGVATIFFLIIIITGIVLWWPRNKQILKQRLKIKADAGFKRLNHDYHVVLGFYSSIFLFVLAFTGLAWSFEWFNKGIYTVTRSTMERAKPLKSAASIDSLNRIGTEAALSIVHSLAPTAHYYNISLPKQAKDAYAISLLSQQAEHESASDTYFVDAYKGNLLGKQLYTDKNLGQRVRATFKPVHVASIYGHTSKIVGVIVCLLGTFFPASGIIMWWNRTRKKRKTA